MHPAIEAVCRGGWIVPLEPVRFEEEERLVIVRLPPPARDAGGLAVQGTAQTDWRSFVGQLRESPHWSGDPLAVQEAMRSEWD
jgi:hypothetical protein